MAFKYSKVASYKWPVTVEVPDNGKYRKESFTGVFRKMGRKTFDGLDDAATEQLIFDAFIGWEDIKDEEGDPIPFSDDFKTELLDDTGFLRGVMAAFLESLQGAPVKN